MTDIFVNQSSNYDGSVLAPLTTATGSIIIRFTGVPGASGARPGLALYSRPGGSTAQFALTYTQRGLDNQAIDLGVNDEYYFMVGNIRGDDQLDLTVSDS